MHNSTYGVTKMLGLDNPIHIAFLLVVLLLVFGAKRLPEMGRSLGSGMRGFKDALTGESPAGELTQPAPGYANAGEGPPTAAAVRVASQSDPVRAAVTSAERP
jgi:sec-independent protein translocase protein TatA